MGGYGSGARPGERRGGRGKGTPNKYTQGQEMRRRRRQTLDGSLAHLTDLMAELVWDARDRARLGEAIDAYIACRERAPRKTKQTRSVVAGVPEPSWSQPLVTELQQLHIDPQSLTLHVAHEFEDMSMHDLAARFGLDVDAILAEAARESAAEDAE